MYLTMNTLFLSFITSAIRHIKSVSSLSEQSANSKNSLIEILTHTEIAEILVCLRQSTESIDTKPYLPTDIWFENLSYYTETHLVTTEDGYILKIFRVLTFHPLPPEKRPVIFLNHGLSGSSNQWLVQEGESNLPQMLADEGYDVWIGNCRGNSYSNKHKTFKPYDQEYWDFSWHEMGIYDVPAVINKILNVTNNAQLYYIGYSMGTTQYMVTLSEKPEYNKQIRKGFLLAPAGIIHSAKTPLRDPSLIELGKNRKYLTNVLLGGRVSSAGDLITYIQDKSGKSWSELCTASSFFNCGICANFVFFIAGFNPKEMNYTAIPSFYRNYADTISTKTMVHYTQLMNHKDGKFQQFDYGRSQNRLKYGKSSPPEYNLTRITVPTYMYYGRGDNVCPPENVEELATLFAPGVIKKMTLIDEYDATNMFNHGDFVLGIHDYQHFIRPIIDAICVDYEVCKPARRRYIGRRKSLDP